MITIIVFESRGQNKHNKKVNLYLFVKCTRNSFGDHGVCHASNSRSVPKME